MTPRRPSARLATRVVSRTYARAPEVCLTMGIDDRVHHGNRHLGVLTTVIGSSGVLMHAPTPRALTIE